MSRPVVKRFKPNEKFLKRTSCFPVKNTPCLKAQCCQERMKGQDEASAGTLGRVQTKCKADFSLSLRSGLHWWEHRPSKSYTEVLCKYSHFLSKEEERSLPPSRQEQCLLVFLAIINHDQNKLLPWNWRPSDKRIPMCLSTSWWGDDSARLLTSRWC